MGKRSRYFQLGLSSGRAARKTGLPPGRPEPIYVSARDQKNFEAGLAAAYKEP